MTRRTISSYWAGNSHRALRGISDPIMRLAIALTPVRSIIRVVDDSQPPMTVEWSHHGTDGRGKSLATSYTDFTGGRIALNPLPVTDDKTDNAAAIDVVTGFALHEASHAKHSRDRWKSLVQQEGSGPHIFAGPMQVAVYLWNLVEDVRIEAATTAEWPGFGVYFDNLLDWMWETTIKDKVQPRVAFGPKIEDVLRLVYLACRYPAKAAKLSPALQPEIKWWQAWQRDYLTDAVDTMTTIQRGLDHLAIDPDTAAEMQKMTKAERREREAGERLAAQIERLAASLGNAPMPCANRGIPVGAITDSQAHMVEELVNEQLVSVPPIIFHDGDKIAAIRVSKPTETPRSKRAFIGKPNATTEALRASLVFRSERPRYEVKLQRNGEMDDEELYRFGLGDDRLFTQRVVDVAPDTLLGLLVDMSGSMVGSNLETAQRLAQLFLWATHDMEGVTTHVWGHTGDMLSSGSDIYQLWEPGDPQSRLGLISTITHGNNYDGYAIAWCADWMRNEEQPQKILIVLSDGYPQGHGYGGDTAERHMRDVCRWAAQEGVGVIQIAIDSVIRPGDQERMFGAGNYVLYQSDQQLPRDLTNILGRYVR